MYSDPRPCQPDEMPGLLRLVNRVFRPNGGDMEREYPLAFNTANAENLRVIDRGGEIVAHVGVSLREAVLLGVPLRVASIGAVGTDPAHRGAGLASRLMEDARAHAIAHGADLMLISGGRGLYHRLGYVQVGRFPRYRVPPPTDRETVEVTEYTPADLPVLQALYEREPVRFRRPREDWERVTAAGMLMNRRATLYVARLSDEIVGYLAVQWPREGEDGQPGPARAYEYAGDRGAIAAAASVVTARMGVTALEIVGPDGDPALAAHAAARGWESAIQSFPGTLGVLRADALLSKLRPWIEERLGSEASRLRIHAAGTEARFEVGDEAYLTTTPGELTALLFGGDTEEARRIPPLTGRIGETLRALFPMPLLWYGYNYV